jgi:Rrf2 family transcriptional regulator, iron-sulfur cluster assembly transcription factor
MRLTKAGEYAVRCVLYLSMQPAGAVTSRNEIADAMEIPRDFLTKIAQQLSRSNILEIIQGPKGGLRLALPSDQVTLLGVVEAVIGEIYLNDCLMRPDICHRIPTCAVYQVWKKARGQLRQTLEETTFASLQTEQICLDDLCDSKSGTG